MYICTFCVHECFPIYHVQSSPIPSDFPRKKHAIEWDTVSSISPGLRAIESTHAIYASIAALLDLARVPVTDRGTTKDEREREKAFEVVWEN